MANLFVKTPLAVLEADMPPTHKIGIQWFMYTCWRDKCNVIRGTYRGVARLLHLAKSSFIKRILPAWIAAGWVTAEYDGKEVALTLLDIACPTTGHDEHTTEDTDVPPRDKTVPPRDKSVPLVSSKSGTVRREITESLEESNNVTCLLKEQKWDAIPELTPELGLDLVRAVLDVPPRPKAGRALELWMQRWYEPMVALIADQRPITGPLAWAEIDEVIRFMASPESGWMKTIGRLPTLENVVKTRHIQHEQMARQGWQSDARTPYPGLAEEEQERPTEGHAVQAASGIRDARLFASRDDLCAFAADLIAANPTLICSVDTFPDGFGLFIQQGTDDYLCIDAEIWNHPSPEELVILYQAIDYGYCVSQVQQAVAV